MSAYSSISEPLRSLQQHGCTLVEPSAILERIEPGMSIFLSTGSAEPRTLVQALMTSRAPNLRDIELVQAVSLSDALHVGSSHPNQYRLRTFFAGFRASEAIERGEIDLVPAQMDTIPDLIRRGSVHIDAAFIQCTPPDANGFVSLGLAVDLSRSAMEQAALVVGEVHAAIPRTIGDTLVHVSEFSHFIEAQHPPVTMERWGFDATFDQVAANIASLIEDRSRLFFTIGPLFEALARHLSSKKDLGMHAVVLTDSVMDLIRSGAVTNRTAPYYRGKTIASWALGTEELYTWLHQNPLVEFQAVDIVANPRRLAEQDRFVAIVPARKVDLTGGIALHVGKGLVPAPAAAMNDLLFAARLSRGGLTIAGLPSRNRSGAPNILLSTDPYPNQLNQRATLDVVVTEFGMASLRGRSLRERAQALIDVAHPDDRSALFEEAKAAHILYPDQIFLQESGRLYPSEIAVQRTFKGDLPVRIRALRPSDEEMMRRLFYRFSDETIFYRYFTQIKTMPHHRMQTYVNIDYRSTLAIVAEIGSPGQERLIAEARYTRIPNGYADIAFVVEEEFHQRGIASFLFSYLTELALKRGIRGFVADVLTSNRPMMKIFEHAAHPVEAQVHSGVYEVKIHFPAPSGRPV